MKVKLVILFFVTLFMSACSDKSYTIAVDFSNESSYDITFVMKTDKYEEGKVVQTTIKDIYTIKTGESRTIGASDFGAMFWWQFWLNTRIDSIRFGDSVMVDIGDRYGNVDNYTLVKSAEQLKRYSYTFTDEDYHYALEQSTNITN